MAEGTDMGGSVRIPAGLCGIVGLKPSLGRIPMDIIGTSFCNISHFGPLTRTIDDAALFIDTVQGPHHCDIQSLPRCDLPIPVQGCMKGIKLAVDADLGFCALESGVEKNFIHSVDILRKAGADIEEVNLGWDADIV